MGITVARTKDKVDELRINAAPTANYGTVGDRRHTAWEQVIGGYLSRNTAHSTDF